GAIHVALPLETRVLAGEKQTAERPREPLAQRRIERRIEVRIAAARPRIGFPDDLPPREQLRARRAEPLERAGQARHAVPGGNRLGGLAGGSAGQQRQDSGPAALLLVAVPERAERQIAAERAGPARGAPESLRELKERFGGAAVTESRDRL